MKLHQSLFALAIVSTPAFAFNFQLPIGFLSPTPSSNSSFNQIETLALNMAVTYGKMDPEYAPILAALNINNGTDLKNFLSNSSSGSNFQDVISHLVTQAGQKNPDDASLLKSMNLTKQTDVKKYLTTANVAKVKSSATTQNQSDLFQMALAQAQSNPSYSSWLGDMKISNYQDIQKLFTSGGTESNLDSMLMSYAKNSQYGQYISIFEALRGGSGDTSSLDLGSFSGLSNGEIGSILAGAKK